MIGKILQLSPSHRWSVSKLLRHPWMQLHFPSDISGIPSIYSPSFPSSRSLYSLLPPAPSPSSLSSSPSSSSSATTTTKPQTLEAVLQKNFSHFEVKKLDFNSDSDIRQGSPRVPCSTPQTTMD